MIIAGLDISLTSPGVVRAVLDENLDIQRLSWMGFTDVQKVHKACSDNLFYYKKFNCYIDRSIWMREKIMDFLYPSVDSSVHYVAIEDYAFDSTGKAYHIGGFTEILKLSIYEKCSFLRWYDISLIKKFATGKGNSDKLSMYDAYMGIPANERVDISHLPVVDYTKGKSPTSDLIDAFFIMKMLQMELKLRRGILTMRDLSEDQIWIFNRVTQTSKENILTRDFVKKN